MLKADGFNDAIIGEVSSFGREGTILYSVQKIINILVERDGMTPEEAYEYYEFNIAGCYLGEGMPTYLDDLGE
jgi:hypothetical protein|tara:strand:+ start:4824 stop:5042 length:219 start_codon:yes stop_codon:yes gene_type:complete